MDGVIKHIDNCGLYTIATIIKKWLSYKQNKLIDGFNIKTLNNQSILGLGDIEITGCPDYLVYEYVINHN